MPANIEFKARLRNAPDQERAAELLAGVAPEILFQRDTFFHANHGRLKLREISGADPHLIQYFRDDSAEVRRSDYLIVPVADPAMFVEAMDRAQGIRGIVRKVRKLWIVGQTRIHFDSVDGLGEFVELEVVLKNEQTDDDGRSVAEKIMKSLDIRHDDIIECAYIDLIEQGEEQITTG